MRTRKTSLITGLLATTMLTTMGAGSAFAQLDEIIVTAEKREQSLQDVPISIAAFTADDLDVYGIDELEDIGQNVPNFYLNNFNNDANTVRLFIRGIGQNDVQVTQDPSVALYIDGVYVGTSIGSGIESLDLERVEILRGPQGTLYGRNATGGAVNLISAKPVIGELGGKLDMTGGNYNIMKVKGSVNLPVGDHTALKLGVLRSERDGVVENLGPGLDWGTEDRWGFRADLRIQPADNFTIDYSYDRSELRDSSRFEQPAGAIVPNLLGGQSFSSDGLTFAQVVSPVPVIGTPDGLGGTFNGLPALVGAFTTPITSDRLDSAVAARPVTANDVVVEGHSLNLSWDVAENLTIKSISSYREVQSDNNHDGTPTLNTGFGLVVIPGGTSTVVLPGAIVGGGTASVTQQRKVFDYKQYSTELQAIGNAEMGGTSIDYVAGIYYYHDEAEEMNTGVNIFPRDTNNATSENESLAFYGQATITPGAFEERAHLTLGARWSQDDREATRINENSLNFVLAGGVTAGNCVNPALATALATAGACVAGVPAVPGGTVFNAPYSNDFDNFSPSVTLAFDVTDDVNIYAKWVNGYKSGGTSTRSATLPLFASGFQEEEVTSYEIGLKGDFFDNTLRVNAAAFMMEQDAFQLSVQTGASAGDRDFIGVDGNEITGFELDVDWAVTDNLTLSGSYGYLDTEYGQSTLSYIDSLSRPVVVTLAPGLSYAPENSWTAVMDYHREIANAMDFNLNVRYSYQDGSITSSNDGTATTNPAPLPPTIGGADNRQLDDRSILDATLTLRPLASPGWAENVKVSFWGKNLLDEEYQLINAGSFAFIGISDQATYGDPRTYGVSLGIEF